LISAANLALITKPTVCSQTATVFDKGLYEKSLCYVKRKATYNIAKAFCLKYGMQLYQENSSLNASSAIFNFVKKAFGGSSKAVVFIEGSDGVRCQTFSGTGKRNYDWCTLSYTFICEFNSVGPPLTPKESLEVIYTKFFTFGLASSDLESTKASFKNVLQSLGVNTAKIDEYIAALKAYLAIVVSTPTEAQKTVMTSMLDLFDLAEKAFIKSFEGLVNMDFAFSFDSRNIDFNSKRKKSTAAKTALRSNPQNTYSYFADPTTPTKFAEYYVAAIDVSNRIKIKL
jgi:hypothetical protein